MTQAIDYFEHAIKRAEHLLQLYQWVNDTGTRRGREPFMKKIQSDLGQTWKGKQCIRVWGKNKKSFLIVQVSKGMTENIFREEYTSEILRACLVSATSALDRYLHEIVMDNILDILRRKEEEIPKRLRNFSINLNVVKKALEKKRGKELNSGNRKRAYAPRSFALIKKAVQDELHEKTFQSRTGIEEALSLLGIRSFWEPLAKKLNEKNAFELIEKINSIFQVRNSIVHEGHLEIRLRARDITLIPISEKETSISLEFIKKFIHVLDQFIKQYFTTLKSPKELKKQEIETI